MENTLFETTIETSNLTWHHVAAVADIPENGSAAVLIEGIQIAIFNFTTTGEWYATQNLCPHKMQMVLSRGIIGDCEGEPKVACPLHKNSFSLQTGECLSGADYKIDTYPIKQEGDKLFIALSISN